MPPPPRKLRSRVFFMASCLGLLLLGSAIQVIRISHWAMPAALFVVAAIFRWLVAFQFTSKEWDQDLLAACTLAAIVCGCFLAISPGWMRRVAVYGFATFGTVAYACAILLSDARSPTAILGLPILGACILALRSLCRKWDRPRRFPIGRCARCGYQIAGLTALEEGVTCPECGWVEDEQGITGT